MITVRFLLILCALICFVLSGFTVDTGRVNTFRLAFAFLTATLLA